MKYDNSRREQYIQKLKDPRWQKKRLEIFQRDNFTCQECNSTDKTLNVHHVWYEKNAEPWEYPEEALLTLCEGCHKEETEQRWEAEQRLLQVLRQAYFSFSQIHGLADFLRKGASEEEHSLDPADVLTVLELLGHEEAFNVLMPRIRAAWRGQFDGPDGVAAAISKHFPDRKTLAGGE